MSQFPAIQMETYKYFLRHRSGFGEVGVGGTRMGGQCPTTRRGSHDLICPSMPWLTRSNRVLPHDHVGSESIRGQQGSSAQPQNRLGMVW